MTNTPFQLSEKACAHPPLRVMTAPWVHGAFICTPISDKASSEKRRRWGTGSAGGAIQGRGQELAALSFILPS